MIDRELAGFLEQGLSLYVGARDACLQPEGARAVAVRVDTGGQHLEVFVPEAGARRILPPVDANGQVAISFARPEDDRACQVKGMAVGIRPAADAERPIVEAQWAGFMRQLECIGIPPVITTGWSHWPAIVIRVRVTAVFEQTPGPQAGTVLA